MSSDLSKIVDQGAKPKELLEYEDKKYDIINSVSNPQPDITSEESDTNEISSDVNNTKEVIDKLDAQINTYPKEFTVTLENDLLSFDFQIFEYQILDFAVVCILRENAFTLDPKSEQCFNLILDKRSYPVYYVGKPQYLRTFKANILFFLRDLEKDDE